MNPVRPPRGGGRSPQPDPVTAAPGRLPGHHRPRAGARGLAHDHPPGPALPGARPGEVRMVHGGVSLTPEALRPDAFADDGRTRPGTGWPRGRPAWSGRRTRSRSTPDPPRSPWPARCPKDFRGCGDHALDAGAAAARRAPIRRQGGGARRGAAGRAARVRRADHRDGRWNSCAPAPSSARPPRSTRSGYAGSPAEASVQRRLDRDRRPGRAGGDREVFSTRRRPASSRWIEWAH